MQLGAFLFYDFNKKIVLEMSVYPELISGIVVKAGDVVIDGSLKTQLKNLQLRLEHGY
ncbi:MAG: F0F1 ATP synthase subunit delta [Candidatus Tectomicrobia bacterium]|uniref:F0F1 ATP synthase subunit delta n=1 Tax=Tectimicrobiota bacterium TaxID=2528274 RepID=A0A933GKW0_UNCTE|nr:F0F1 ATP synthase subunit delta [Candidatus Tectomicrobia bacterium]